MFHILSGMVWYGFIFHKKSDYTFINTYTHDYNISINDYCEWTPPESHDCKPDIKPGGGAHGAKK